MKRITFFFTLLLLCVQSVKAQQPVAIAGTKFSLIPPEGFITASNFSGFQDAEKGASIMINELPSSYFQMRDGFTAASLKTKGMVLLSKEEVTLQGKKATYFQLSQAANGITYLKQLLMFGDENKTVMVNGIYPEKLKTIEKPIKASIFTITYNESQDDNPFDAVKFTIDVSGTPYEFVKYVSGSMLYSEGGKMAANEGIFIVSTSIGRFPESNRRQYAIDRLKKLPGGEQLEVKEVNTISINNLNGFEIKAEGKNKDSKTQIVYQIMLYAESNYYIMVGQAANDLSKNLDIFKKIAWTFRLK